MNKILSYTVLMAATLSLGSCVSEEDDIFDKTAAERLNEASALYSSRLEASPYGWAMQLYPTYDNAKYFGTGYLLLMDFDANHSVKVGMNNALSFDNYLEDVSTWDVITDNGPVLSFSSYNQCLHAFSNPEDLPFTSERGENEQGTGIGGDYEFIIVDAPEDASYMMLKGKKRGTYNLLTPLQEGVVFKDYLAEINEFSTLMFGNNILEPDVLHMGDAKYRFADAADGVPAIYPYDGDEVTQSLFNPFLITKRDGKFYLRFRDELTLNEETVQDFCYDEAQDRFVSVDNDKCYLEGPAPLPFFVKSLNEDNKRWIWTPTSAVSESHQALLDGVNSVFASKKGSLRTVSLRNLGGQITLRITYKTKNDTNLDYKFTLSQEGETVKLTYVEPASNSATNLYNNYAEIKALVDGMSRTYNVEGGTTNFDLHQIKLIGADDATFWFVADIN